MKPITKYLVAAVATVLLASVAAYKQAQAQPVPVTVMTFCDEKSSIRVSMLGMRPFDVAVQSGNNVILGMSARSYFGSNEPTPEGFLFAFLPKSKSISELLIFKDKLIVVDTAESIPFCGVETAVPELYRKISASGPDFFQTRGLSPSQSVAIKKAPTSGSATIGQIPFNGQGIKNLGCAGGWCLVEWNGLRGHVQIKYLAEGRSRV